MIASLASENGRLAVGSPRARTCNDVKIICMFLAVTGFTAATFGATTMPSLRVLNSAGRPAAGATAVLVPPGHNVNITGGKIADDEGSALRRATADAAGDVRFDSLPNDCLLAVLSDDGWAVQPPGRVASPVALTPWAAVHGRRLVGREPAAHRKIDLWAVHDETEPYDPNAPTATFIERLEADADGRFAAEQLPDGTVNLADATVYQSWRSRLDRPLILLHPAAGKTSTIDFGGQGRRVVGRFEWPVALAGRGDVELANAGIWQNDPPFMPTTLPGSLREASLSEQARWWEDHTQKLTRTDLQRDEAGQQANYEHSWERARPFDPQPDGRFDVADVLPGRYSVDAELRTRKSPGVPSVKLVECNYEFTVKPGEQPLELPPIHFEAAQDVTAGQLAPEFDLPGFDDRRVRLSDYRGQLVLLDFWATWCGPCVGEMPELKTIYDRYGADGRLAMLSLSIDQRPDLPKQFFADHGLAWRQAFVGVDHPVQKAYGVEGIPSLWLIDRNGVVLGRNLTEARMVEAIEKALRPPATAPAATASP